MLASIDVGSNSLRMLVGEVVDDRVVPLHHFRQTPRLGGGITEVKGLAPDAMERALSVLVDFADTIDRLGVNRIRAVGTQALRRACNGVEFSQLAEQMAGIKIDILSGEEEAELSALGAISVLDEPDADRLLVDIGGGSTEIISIHSGSISQTKSYPLGAVSLMEEAGSPALVADTIESTIKNVLSDFSIYSHNCSFAGTAGTITTIAAYDLKMTNYDWRKINNYRISLSRLSEIFKELLPLSVHDRESLPGIEKGRGDIILYGLALLISLMEQFKKMELEISDFGLLEGVLLRLNSV